MEPTDLFVFAGAGASYGPPAALPMFDQLRDAVLVQLHLDEYGPSAEPLSRERLVATGLSPEPFLLRLHQAGAPVERWLALVLGGARPNAVHVALASLAKAGAAVWTVNFDRLIESAHDEVPLEVSAWPDDPSPTAQLLKAHGSLGGKLVFAADQVLAGLPAAWLGRLCADVEGRTVVFVGYSGRDLDFRPEWDRLFIDCNVPRVIWFDLIADDAAAAASESERKRRLLPMTAAAGRLSLGSDAVPAPDPNPSVQFITWLERQGLCESDAGLVSQLRAERPDRSIEPIGHPNVLVEGAMRELLGDTMGARKIYLRALRQGSLWRQAATDLVTLTANHGGSTTALALAVPKALPPIGRIKLWQAAAARKRATILYNSGRHDDVLRVTRHAERAAASTLLILRAGSLRFIGDLDLAASTAKDALHRSVAERHNIRAAHAAFQYAFALVLGGRLDEAQKALEEKLRPYAELAASRWVAWADFVEAALSVYQTRPPDAIRHATNGAERFRSESLLDGVVQIELVRLPALRQSRLIDDFDACVEGIEKTLTATAGDYYARGHSFTGEALAFERAERARCHSNDPRAACHYYQIVAASRYSLHRAMGHLGQGLAAEDPDERNRNLQLAHETAQKISARNISTIARRVIGSPPVEDHQIELFLP